MSPYFLPERCSAESWSLAGTWRRPQAEPPTGSPAPRRSNGLKRNSSVSAPVGRCFTGSHSLRAPALTSTKSTLTTSPLDPPGFLVVETKYHSSALDLGAERLDFRLKRDAEQANRNAQRVRNLLRDVAPAALVMPVLVYWGRLVASPAGDIRQLGPVQVVHGRMAKQWIPVIIDRPQELAPGLIERIVARLEERASLPSP